MSERFWSSTVCALHTYASGLFALGAAGSIPAVNGIESAKRSFLVVSRWRAKSSMLVISTEDCKV